MLDWLGITIHVSSWRDKKLEEQGRKQLQQRNPLHALISTGRVSPATPSLAVESEHAKRVHKWLCGRLRSGYHNLSALLVELDRLDHEYTPSSVQRRKLCVSLCGSHRALLQTKEHMATAKEKLHGGHVDISYELAADYHG